MALTVRLGKTGITTIKNGFGAIPIQRISFEESTRILRRAYESGVTYYDTARGYTDSEERIGLALGNVRDKIYLATKTPSKTVEGFWADLETSLGNLKTGYIDVYQFHNPDFVPRPGDGTGLYEAMLEAKAQGKIRFIGITNHSGAVAREAVESGLYDLLQFPFSYLSDEQDRELVRLCEERDVGFVAMKALSGGLITNGAAAYAALAEEPWVLPIWGIQRMEELEEFIACQENPPAVDGEMQAAIERDRRELMGEFCRGCGYCMPCPVGIQINFCARMSHLIRRSVAANQLTESAQAMMAKVEECLHCGQCAAQCPYHLDPPALLEKNYADYRAIVRGEVTV